MRAAGVSIDDLREQLRNGYGEVMQNPVVTITPLFRVALMGQVGRPGVYSITPAYSLLDLIGEAGGFSLAADQERVRIVRPGTVFEYDALRALESGQDLDVVRLRSGDQIIVPTADPPTNWRSVLDFLNAVTVVVVLWDRFSN